MPRAKARHRAQLLAAPQQALSQQALAVQAEEVTPAAVHTFAYLPAASIFFNFFFVTVELSTLRQMMKVPNEPGLSPNNDLENAYLSDQSMASNCHAACLPLQLDVCVLACKRYRLL